MMCQRTNCAYVHPAFVNYLYKDKRGRGGPARGRGGPEGRGRGGHGQGMGNEAAQGNGDQA